MCDYFQAGSFECADCVIIDRQRVPAPDVTGAVWMYGLQSQLHPNGFDLIEALQKGQDIWPKAVRRVAIESATISGEAIAWRNRASRYGRGA